MSLNLVTFGQDEVEVERVCRAEGCKNRFYTIHNGGGGRVKEYCGDACKTRAHRKGKAYNALNKSQQLQSEADKLAEEARFYMRKADELMRQADLALVAMKVAQKENEWDRLQEDFKNDKA